VPALERRELAASQGASQKHRQNRPVPFSFHRLDLRLSEQVAGLFPGEPVPCPVAGLMDALEGQDCLTLGVSGTPVRAFRLWGYLKFSIRINVPRERVMSR
jgi:hypothetical protein